MQSRESNNVSPVCNLRRRDKTKANDLISNPLLVLLSFVLVYNDCKLQSSDRKLLLLLFCFFFNCLNIVLICIEQKQQQQKHFRKDMWINLK